MFQALQDLRSRPDLLADGRRLGPDPGHPLLRVPGAAEIVLVPRQRQRWRPKRIVF